MTADDLLDEWFVNCGRDCGRTPERAISDAQALADVQTLDDWAARNSCDPFKTHPYQAGTEWHCVSAYQCKRFRGTTPDEARAKAAAWVREQA